MTISSSYKGKIFILRNENILQEVSKQYTNLKNYEEPFYTLNEARKMAKEISNPNTGSQYSWSRLFFIDDRTEEYAMGKII